MSTASGAPWDYVDEVRLGVVMYGGVSLAIYIYGVSRELFELACATPAQRDGALRLPEDLEGTRKIYQRLARLASDAELRARYAQALAERKDWDAAAQAPMPMPDVWRTEWDEGPRTRFVIDVITGTSAGGINGIFLAKALALAQPFGALRDLWVDDGDLGKLLNDREAAKGIQGRMPEQTEGPKSLLSSDRMFHKLHEALERMAAQGSGSAPVGGPLDLYITTTDIAGAPVPLRLFDKVVLERRHRQRFHFSLPSRLSGSSTQDFESGNHAMLAYAARCTSSFPFAFEPMTLSRVIDLLPQYGKADLDRLKPYFDALPDSVLQQAHWQERPFGDGGYLYNKPFSYAAEALAERFGDVPAARKLFYVEPSPEGLDLNRDSRPGETPNAVQNAVAALTTIPQYQTIREDLLAIQQRNRRIERVERILMLDESDVERVGDGFSRVRCVDGKVPDWSTLSLDTMVRYYGSGFRAYRRLRVYAVTDWLAEQVGAAMGIDPESDHSYALRAVLRYWRDARFEDNPPEAGTRRSVNAFLNEHDLEYRLRRTTFVMRRIDQITRLLRQPHPALDPNAKPDPDEPHSGIEVLIAKAVRKAMGPIDLKTDDAQRARVLNQLRWLKGELRENYDQLVAERKDWLRGKAVESALRGGGEENFQGLREELQQALAMLIGELKPDALKRLRFRSAKDPLTDVTPPVQDAPDFGVWLRTGSVAFSLQDTVYERVERWFEESLHQAHPAKLLLWQRLYEAMQATRVDAVKSEHERARKVASLLNAQWHLLGGPQLTAVALSTPVMIDGETRTHQARLDIHTATAIPGGGPLQSEPARVCEAMLRLLGRYYLSFDAYDQSRFSMYYGTDTGEPAVVDIVRVSPVDAESLRGGPAGADKLAGTRFAHFGAFLDEQWRRNDVMWGRLDGIDRLISALLPEDEHSPRIRAELMRLAQGFVLTHTLKTKATTELTRHLTELVRADTGPLTDRLKRLLGGPDVPDTEMPARLAALRETMASSLAGLLDPEALRGFAMVEPTFDPQPPTAPTLRMAARAVAITGQVLEGVSTDPAAKPLGRWMARLGLVLQGVIAVSVPGALAGISYRHIMVLVGAMEFFLLLGALLLGDASLKSTALALIGVTVFTWVLTGVLGDVLRQRKHKLAQWVTRRGRWLLRGIVMAFAGLAVAGGMALYHRGLDALHAPAAASSPAKG